jgi:RNA polymerase sigma-70 factor, ECF subfamily
MNIVGGRQMSSMNEGFSFTASGEEQRLLACARAGDSEAFEKLVKPHWGALLRVTQRILRNREDAEDAVQTALLHAWCRLDAFQGRSRFSSWLIRIAINVAFMRLRANRRKDEVSFEDLALVGTEVGFHVVESRPNPEQELSAKEVLSLVESALGRLKPRHLEVFEMSVAQEMTGIEAARILNVSVTTVKSRLYRARTVLSRFLQPKLGPRRQRAYGADQGAPALVPSTASGA